MYKIFRTPLKKKEKMYQNVANKIIHRFNIDYIRFENVFDHSIAKNIQILTFISVVVRKFFRLLLTNKNMYLSKCSHINSTSFQYRLYRDITFISLVVCAEYSRGQQIVSRQLVSRSHSIQKSVIILIIILVTPHPPHIKFKVF